MRNLYSTSAMAVISAALLSTTWAGSAAAQTAPVQATPAQDAATTTVDDIVVTAQRRTQNLQDVPIAISALGGEQLKERQIESVADLAATLPGVKFAEFSGAGNVYIRGVGTTLTTGAGESSIAAHVDGIYIGMAQATTMVQDDLGRVEVLRGPQSTLYGRNSTGGVINYISAAPTDEFAASVSALYGNYDRKQLQGFISGPVTDNIRVRLFGKYQDRDGYTENVANGQKLDGITQTAGRLSVDADITPTWTTNFRLTADHEDMTGPVFDAYYAPLTFPGMQIDPRKVSSPTVYDSFKEIYVASLKNEFKVGDYTLTSLTGYVDFTFNAFYDGVAALTPVVIDRDAHSKDFSQEFNLSGSVGNLDFISGLYYYQSNKDVLSLTDYHLLFPIPNNLLTQSSEQKSYSAFGDATYNVSDSVRVYGGLRYSVERLDQSLDSPGVCSGTNIQKYKDEGVSGRLGSQWDVSGGVMIYGQYSHGYKPGGFSSSRCNSSYEAETIDALEAGVKSTLPNGRGTLNASVYYYDYTNLQLEQIVVGGAPVVNAPKARIFGAEAQLMYRLTDNLRLDLGLAYLDAEFREFISNDASLGTPGTDLAGFPLNNSPKFSGNFALENTFDLSSSANLKLRAEVTYTSTYNVREFDKPYVVIDPYAMVNAFAQFNLDNDRYSVRVYGKNLTDETILASAIGFRGVPLGSFAPPRMYGLEVTSKF